MKKNILLIIILILGVFLIPTGCNKEPDEPVIETAFVGFFLDGKLIDEQDIPVGTKVDFVPMVSTVESGEKYLFLGWYDITGEVCLDNTIITTDIDLYAKIIKYGTKYKITYHMNDEADFEDMHYPGTYLVGETTSLIDPVRPLNYRFLGWYDNAELSGEPITEIPSEYYGNIDLWDSWEDLNTYHNITYVADGASSYSEEKETKVMEGREYQLPYPIKDGYYFRGWYLEDTYQTRVYKIETTNTSDVTLFAKFVEKTASNTYISFVGDSISTYHGTIPEDAGAYYPTFVDFPVEDTYFMKVVSGMGYNFLKNNSYSGSRLSSEVVTSDGQRLPAAVSDKRLAGLADENNDPDILIVHLGTNEYSQGVSVVNYKAAIVKYIKKLRALYDDVEIYFCLHPYNGYGPGYVKVREEYNAAIISYAEKYNFKTLDLTKCWDKDTYNMYIYSNAHPNKAGFKRMAEVIIEELKKYHNNEY